MARQYAEPISSTTNYTIRLQEYPKLPNRIEDNTISVNQKHLPALSAQTPTKKSYNSGISNKMKHIKDCCLQVMEEMYSEHQRYLSKETRSKIIKHRNYE